MDILTIVVELKRPWSIVNFGNALRSRRFCQEENRQTTLMVCIVLSSADCSIFEREEGALFILGLFLSAKIGNSLMGWIDLTVWC